MVTKRTDIKQNDTKKRSDMSVTFLHLKFQFIIYRNFSFIEFPFG